MADNVTLNRAADPASYAWKARDIGGAGTLYVPFHALSLKDGTEVDDTHPLPAKVVDASGNLLGGAAGQPVLVRQSDGSAAFNSAKDSTLTDGTQRAILRGGAKGSTSAADVTSTASGTDHQAADVILYDASGSPIGTSANKLNVVTSPGSITRYDFASVATTGLVVHTGTGVCFYYRFYNSTGGSIIPMFFDASSDPGNGATPKVEGSIVATGSNGSANVGHGTWGFPYTTALLLIYSSTAGTLTKIASTSITGWVVRN